MSGSRWRLLQRTITAASLLAYGLAATTTTEQSTPPTTTTKKPTNTTKKPTTTTNKPTTTTTTPKCDMDECYYMSSTKYVGDQLDGGKSTSEISPAYCQARCANTTGCKYFTYDSPPSRLPNTDGDCTLYGSSSKKEGARHPSLTGPAQWPECCTKVPRLVNEIVTFGGVAVSYPAGSNPGDECIEGVRIFTENTKLPGGGVGHQEDAAAMITRYPHVRAPVLILHPDDDEPSYTMGCTKGVDTEGPPEATLPERMPLMKAMVYHDWGIHGLNGTYGERLKNVTMDPYPFNLTKKKFEELVDFTIKITQMGSATYSEGFQLTKDAVEDFPPWRLVGYANTQAKKTDPDVVLLLQHPENGLCTINFEGSDTISDLASFGRDFGTGFCGFSNTHVGVRNELWQIVASDEYKDQIKANLPFCRRVACIGHSLGGALCELFVTCANSNRKGDPDYDLLAWEPAEEWKLLPELLEDPDTVSLSEDVPALSGLRSGPSTSRGRLLQAVAGLAAVGIAAVATLLASRRRQSCSATVSLHSSEADRAPLL